MLIFPELSIPFSWLPKISELEKFYEKFDFSLFKEYRLDDVKHFWLKF